MLHIIDSALRHGFSEDELRRIWDRAPEDSVVRVRHWKQPPHYMAIGFTDDGKHVVELLAYTDGFDWWLFHAKTPPTGGFKKEYIENGGIL